MILPCKRDTLLSWIIVVLIFLHQTLSAQLFYTAEKINTDSLMKVLPGTSGESRIRMLNKLAAAYLYTNPERSLEYAFEADSLLPDHAGTSLFFETRLTLGKSWMSQGRYDRAVNSLLDAYEVARSAGRLDWQYLSGKPLLLVYLYTSNDEIAEHLLNEFLQFDRSAVPGLLLFEIMIGVAWANWSFLGNYEEALKQQHVCLAVSDTVPIRKPNLALCYYQMGICHSRLNRLDSADRYFMKAERICENYGITSLEHYKVYWVDLLCKARRYDEALTMIRELTALSENRQQHARIGGNYQTWGEILAELNRPAEAVPKFEKALEYGGWVKNNKALSADSAHNMDYWYTPEQNVKIYVEEIGIRILRDAHFSLFQQYEKLKKPNLALYHHVKYENEKSALTKLERSRMVMELETRYQTEKKEQQILALEQQTEVREAQLRLREYLLMAVSFLSVVIIILAVTLIRQNRLRARHDTLVIEQRLLRSQMNPHFIFNTLANIQTFILREEPEKASRFLAKFSRLVRNILDNSLEEYVSLDREIDTIESYLGLQKIRFAGKFDFSLRVDERIVAEEIYIPPMLCQPFIENSLEHGIRHREVPGWIDIVFSLRDKELLLQIMDDGVGRERARELESVGHDTHRSMATGITTDRLKILNRKSKKQIRLEITDLKDDAGKALGTRVQFVFPL